ncbi:MAG: MFS transporter [Anaerolineae bacterium]
MSSRVLSPELRRQRRAWYMYDLGNSAYAAVVLLAVFSAYFQGTVVGGAEGSRLWGLAIGLAMLVVAIISPILGGVADHVASKKRFLFFFTAVSCVFTGLLALVGPGDVAKGMIFFIIAEIGYRSAQVFYDALLPEIASPEEMGRISGIGWAIGSAGGVVCLLIVLAAIEVLPGMVPALDKGLIVRLSLVFTAVYFAISTIPLFRRVKETADPLPLPDGQTYLSLGFHKLGQTFKQANSFRAFLTFLSAYLIYNNGIMMALNFASIIGAVVFGLDQTALIVFVIIVQITNVIGAYASGWLTGIVGSKRALMGSIALMLIAIVWMYMATTSTSYFAIGALAGFAMAGMQALSRALAGSLAPEGQSAQFFGFFAVAGRQSSFLGPAIYGWLATSLARRYEAIGMAADLAEAQGLRAAIWAIGAFLVVGMGLLIFVRERAYAPAVGPVIEPVG